jgi:hypothetical protein
MITRDDESKMPIAATEKPAFFTAVAPLSMLVTQFAGALVGVTALAYLIGYNYLNAYCSSIGASWVLNLYSPDQIAKGGIGRAPAP